MSRIISFDTYWRLERPNVRWLIHGLLPKPGRFLLIGTPKIGKTNMAIDMAMAVTHGMPFMGCDVEQGRVLFLQIDALEYEWKERLSGLAQSGAYDFRKGPWTVHPDELNQHLPFNILRADSQNWLRGVLQEAAPDLVILDVLRELHMEDENKSDRMRIALAPLFAILRPYAALILHHTPKLLEDQDYDPVRVARGSGYLAGVVTTIGLLHNGKFKVKGRLTPDLTYRIKQTDMGMPSIVDPEPTLRAQLLMEVTAHPGLSGHRLYDHVIRHKYKISRATFFRRIGGYLKDQSLSHPKLNDRETLEVRRLDAR